VEEVEGYGWQQEEQIGGSCPVPAGEEEFTVGPLNINSLFPSTTSFHFQNLSTSWWRTLGMCVFMMPASCSKTVPLLDPWSIHELEKEYYWLVILHQWMCLPGSLMEYKDDNNIIWSDMHTTRYTISNGYYLTLQCVCLRMRVIDSNSEDDWAGARSFIVLKFSRAPVNNEKWVWLFK
jgi:hypothetical protein